MGWHDRLRPQLQHDRRVVRWSLVHQLQQHKRDGFSTTRSTASSTRRAGSPSTCTGHTSAPTRSGPMTKLSVTECQRQSPLAEVRGAFPEPLMRHSGAPAEPSRGLPRAMDRIDRELIPASEIVLGDLSDETDAELHDLLPRFQPSRRTNQPVRGRSSMSQERRRSRWSTPACNPKLSFV